MYIKEINIKNIRGIDQFNWKLHDDELAGWHVIIGDNGSGKTTLLRAIAWGLIGILRFAALPYAHNMLRYNQEKGELKLSLVGHSEYDSTQMLSTRKELDIEIEIYNHGKAVKQIKPAFDDRDYLGIDYGWFSVGFGSFRRFVGEDASYSIPIYADTQRVLSLLTLFDDNFGFQATINWLQELRFKQLEQQSHESKLLEAIKSFINHDDFLPFGVKLKEVSSNDVMFSDADENIVGIEYLGNGYRSILGIILETIRQMSIFYPDKPLFSADGTKVIAPGVVLIDEIDQHLHPSWQREIARQLTEHFPNMQFIVTTHSPLVCQLPADENGHVRGSIWRLPTLGSDEKAYRVHEKNPQTAEEWKRLVYGNILEAYSTDLFGEDIERSPEAQRKLNRISELSLKERKAPLTPDEERELQSLIEELPATSTTTGLLRIQND